MQCILTRLAVTLLLVFPLNAKAQEAVYIIRHAEKEAGDADPVLTVDGCARALDWAQMFRSSGLDVVFVSDARRSHETGEIIASALEIPVTEIPRSETGGLFDLLSFDHAADSVLIVAHTETIPSLLALYNAGLDVVLDQSQFDNLFVIVPGGAAQHLHMP